MPDHPAHVTIHETRLEELLEIEQRVKGTPEAMVTAAVTDALENEYDEGVIHGWVEEAIYRFYNGGRSD